VDLIEFRRALRRHLRVSVVVALMVLAVGLSTTRGTQVKYQATSTVLITPHSERFGNASASVLRVILPNVIVVVRSDSLRADAAARVPAIYRDTPIVVDAAFDNQASVLFVTVTSKVAPAAIAWSAALAQSLSERMKTDKYLEAQVLDPAQGAGLTGKRVRSLGVIASVMLAMAAFVLVAFAAQRLEESRDVANALRRRGVRVLGTLATTRRHRRTADALSVIRAALMREDGETPLFVTALTDANLAHWLANRLRRADEEAPSPTSTPTSTPTSPSTLPFGAALDSPGRPQYLDATAGPLVAQLVLMSAAAVNAAYVLAVDDRVTSVAEVLTGLHELDAAGIRCYGVVLVHGPLRKTPSRRDEARPSS
jgi:hypothetical protein